MEFKKYQHIEKFGNDETDGIENGITYIFPKLDGTNSSVWVENNKICAGSRNRKLSLENDNAGFYAHILKNENIILLLRDYPNLRLFGEFLVRHSITTYKDTAWKKFYVFDVIEEINETYRYIPYDVYKILLDQYNISYIPSIAIVENGNLKKYINLLEKNTYLIKDGHGIGEGIVIKNYEYKNKYGRQIWAKIVTNEFKEKNNKIFGCKLQKTKQEIEEKIVNEFLTDFLIEKEYQKIKLLNNGWESKQIARLLQTLYYEFIKDNMWNILKKYKSPIIDFKLLNNFIQKKIKQTK